MNYKGPPFSSTFSICISPSSKTSNSMLFLQITTKAKSIIIHITSHQSSNHCGGRAGFGGGADTAGSLALADRLVLEGMCQISKLYMTNIQNFPKIPRFPQIFNIFKTSTVVSYITIFFENSAGNVGVYNMKQSCEIRFYTNISLNTSTPQYLDHHGLCQGTGCPPKIKTC